jgi:two-component system, LytTR family, response regulator
MNALRVVIVDDESHARERLIRLLDRVRNVDVVAECAEGHEAVDAVTRLTPDVLFLDVQMPEMDGFGVIRAIPKASMPLVVFVTAFDRHALEAFDVNAVDYLLKPVEAPRLMEAIERARTRLELGDNDRQPETTAPAERFLLRQDGNLHAVAAREILWVEAQGNYARINLANRSYMIRDTMASLERRLDGGRFARVHRSAIINLDAVRELQPWFGGDYIVILTNGAKVRASRTYRSRLDRWVLG